MHMIFGFSDDIEPLTISSLKIACFLLEVDLVRSFPVVLWSLDLVRNKGQRKSDQTQNNVWTEDQALVNDLTACSSYTRLDLLML